MAKLSDFSANLKYSRKVEMGEGIVVTLRPCPNPEFEAYLNNLERKNRHKLRRGFRRETVMKDDSLSFKEAFAHTVLLDIEGADDIEKYDGEIGFALLRQDAYYPFFAACRGEATDMAEFMAEEDEEEAKN